MKAIEANTKVNPGNYFQTASYYLDNGKDLNEALEWINLVLESNPGRILDPSSKSENSKTFG
jgi:hypothetical protein